jgi:predicted membrane chloride channel (bestrophin family)
MPIFRRNHILLKAVPFVAAVIAVKLMFHRYGLEYLSLNAIFSGIIGATVFLLGFLLNGVLGDFKESEKMPGDLSAMLLSMADEIDIIAKSKKDPSIRESLVYIHDLMNCIRDWFYRKERTRAVMGRIRGLNDHFRRLEPFTQANFISRLKQEQNSLRRMVIRIHTIRETDFISSGYLIATSTSGLLLLGLVLAKIEPFYESLFFVGVISYLLIYLLFLIRDLDNPFGHYDEGSSEDVSLVPLHDAMKEIHDRLDTMGS